MGWFKHDKRKKNNKSRHKLLPAETLWDFSKAVDREEEWGIAVATEATQELASRRKALFCGCVFCYHGNGVKQEVLQVVAKVLVLEEL